MTRTRVLLAALLMSLAGSQAFGQADIITPSPDRLETPPTPVRTIKGEILRIDEDQVIVKDRSNMEVRLSVTDQTKIDKEDRKVGDRVEAEVMPDGRAISIVPCRAAQC